MNEKDDSKLPAWTAANNDGEDRIPSARLMPEQSDLWGKEGERVRQRASGLRMK